MSIAITILAALILDRLLGEPRRWHPLVGFGRLAQAIETRLNKRVNNPVHSPVYSSVHNNRPKAFALKFRGLLALSLLILPAAAITAYITGRYNTYLIVEIGVLYLAIGARSLIEHAQRVATALQSNRRDDARAFTSHLVSRDTTQMNESDMSRATIESTLENGNDAIFAPLFWFVIGGAPAVIVYRLCNTLDAMWGYRTPRFVHFGWAAARLDDVLNYIPARLTALTYACLGQFQTALHCWRTQAGNCKSPNGGPVMAAGAGALALQLGGPAVYHGKRENCPRLGCGEPPLANDIMQATRLIQRGIALWAGLALLLAGGLSLA
ncbi:MAG: adenosylcobinamide-phosphate synthase CbiB [Gammaproteobacteria bacterium]|nr:adenosylcobinamide-phosphate synthase CbiB [Gammaproteobacteria bacterium]MCF6364546.1 adenosylcobinamide-phosphate synthase CbiB [Gammaproteobacteria bacterium]